MGKLTLKQLILLKLDDFPAVMQHNSFVENVVVGF
jgi:hypothetical protein